jgi:ParB-like chromosome segregation protein Spo0J
MNDNWCEDFGALDVMDDLGIACKKAVIRIDHIDFKESQKNNAREERLNKDHAESIAMAQRLGRSIPKIVVREFSGRAKHVICGGNHRAEACRINGIDAIPVYVVECSDAEFIVLCQMLNTTVGMGASHELRAKQAAQAVISGSVTEKQAAEMFSVPKSTVNRVRRMIAAREKVAARVGLAKAIKLPEDTLFALSEIQSDKAFGKAVELSTKISAKDFRSTIKQALDSPTEDAIVQAIEKEIEKCETPVRKKFSIETKEKLSLMRAVSMMESWVNLNKSLLETGVRGEELADLKLRLQRIASILSSL